MKILMLIISLVVLDKGCTETKINQDAVSIEYSVQSRGTYKHITINKKMVSVIDKRKTNAKTKSCDKTDWDKIINELKHVNIENIPNLKAPSEARFYDGAAIANLIINYNGKTYKTPSFDHGNPPKEIEALVKEILSISENIE
jgi:hypothetical protein